MNRCRVLSILVSAVCDLLPGEGKALLKMAFVLLIIELKSYLPIIEDLLSSRLIISYVYITQLREVSLITAVLQIRKIRPREVR